jgi:hypothetical protein
MNAFLALLLMLSATIATANETVTVYQLNGARQCAEGREVPVERAADLLRAQGVKVLSAERRLLPTEIAPHCGAPTGEANVIRVAAADWSAFTAQNPDAGGYGRWVFESETLEVYKYDGTLQCGMGEEIPLEAMAEELAKAGVEVLASRKGTDGLAHIAVCGASTGALNVFTIRRERLEAARALGYRMLVSREMTREIKPKAKRTAGIQARPLPKALAPPAEPIPLLW